ncbi:recombinase family protein [Otoolea muris]|uniref:recombinase family protein n=1 Tax=Otoolea muris TaxID=2941515 RepID=UPI00203BED97|nr:recombinase family protein [Otoolea muris]
MKKHGIGLYLRLSDEDGREFRESNSITSQRDILKNYVRSHREFADYYMAEFCDDGYSGTNFARPGVQKLFDQVRAGVISVIMVKDFSRFGRNYIEVGNYLEQVFPFLGIRFISVNDGFDSGVSDFSGEFFDVAFKNLAHDLYSKDLSEKIISVRQMKARRGKCIASYAPYGYLKSPDQKLTPDREAAFVVRRIFHMALEGIPKAHIASTLNREGILTPLMLRRQRGEHFPCKTVNEKSVWRTASVLSILQDQRYAGDTVYGKVKPISVGSREGRAVPREQWMIVPDTHEAIVSREVFERVNLGIKKRSACHREKEASLRGKVRCAGCNRIISRVKRVRSGGRKGATYRCGIQNMAKEFGCCPQTIEECQIETAILAMLRKMAAAVADREMEEASESKTEETEKLLIKCETEVNRLAGRKREKYEAYKDGLLSREAFAGEKAALEKQRNILLAEIEKCRKKLYDDKCGDTGEMDTALRLGRFAPFEALTREIVETFVEQVCICRDGSLRIHWKFKDFSNIF